MLCKILLLTTLVFGCVFSQSILLQAPSPKCSSNDDCQWGYFCLSGVCADKCAMVRCTANTICKQGQCHKICNSKVPCEQGYFCSEGYCLDKCLYTKCAGDHYCEKGKCYPIPKECKVDSDCKKGFHCSDQWKCEADEVKECPAKIQCPFTRPNDKTCPTVYFIRKPDPVVCGVTKDNKLVDFEVECYACKNKSVVYYFNVTCDKVPSQCLNSTIDPPPVDSTEYPEIKCNDPRPDQKTCPTLTWIRKPDPVVCGINKNGEYVDFPVECYACKSLEIVSYFNTTCENLKNQQSKPTCAQVSCDYGFYCEEGKCIESPTSKTIKCTLPRPTEKTCPTLYFIREPDPLVCGVTSKGDLVDFPVECYACKQTDIVYYYNTTCDKIQSITCAAIRCKQGYKCIAGQCVPVVWPVCKKNLTKTTCKAPRPNNTTCPLIYFFVKPQDIVCGVTATGQRISYPVECYACKNKDVMYYYNKPCDELSVPCDEICQKDTDCQEGYSCQNKQCVDKCILTLCPQGTNCLRGQCYKNVQTCKMLCPQGEICVNGGCYKDEPLCKKPCAKDEVCLSGQCVKEVCNKLCIKGYVCQNGQCVKEDKCKDVICIATHRCVDGECVPIAVEDKCKDIMCIATHRCVDGKCVPIFTY